MSDDQQDIVVDRATDAIAIVRLNRPERLNALRPETVRTLRRTLEALGTDNRLRVIVLTGAGRGFCAGLDLKSSFVGEGEGGDGVMAYYAAQELFAGMVQRIRALDKVVIAAVNGVAVGAGFALTLGADIRLAARSASFHVGAVRIGLTAGECGISYHLPRLIGASRAFEVMLTGRPIPAEEALRIGLVSDVVEDAGLEDAGLLDRALELAADVLRNSPYATAQTKRVMWANLDAGSLDAALELENRAQVLALMTEDFAEATRAFSEKRAPTFRGK